MMQATSPRTPLVRYDLLCHCGRKLAGERQARHQVLICPGCARPVFVLPGPFSPRPRPNRRRWWLAPLVVGAALLLALGSAFAYLAPYLGREPERKEVVPPDLASDIRAGRDDLGQGKFHLARGRFDAALAARHCQPGRATPEESRELVQLQRQADLLCRLLPIPLEEVVRQAKLVRDPEEWSMQFASYRGKSVLFDDRVRRAPGGRPRLADHVIEADGDAVRLALEDFEVLNDLPLDDGPRMVFGGRIDACMRDEDGWVIRFAADSGVLMTDPDALAACLPGPADAGLKDALARQQKWLDERPAQGPARP